MSKISIIYDVVLQRITNQTIHAIEKLSSNVLVGSIGNVFLSGTGWQVVKGTVYGL